MKIKQCVNDHIHSAHEWTSVPIRGPAVKYKCNGKGVVDDSVDHPAHYGGADNPYEAIKVIEKWKLGFHLGNCVKYIARAGRKPDAKLIVDLKKARWYLDRFISKLEAGEGDD